MQSLLDEYLAARKWSQPPASHDLCLVKACDDATDTGRRYTLAAVIAGFFLLEKRETTLSCIRLRDDHTKPEENKFVKWVELSTGISSATAYRWMKVAEFFARRQLGIADYKPFSPYFEDEGEKLFFSAIMVRTSSVSERAENFRQGIADDVSDWSLGKAYLAAIDGELSVTGMVRSINGKVTGGSAGEDRKNFPIFIRDHLLKMDTSLAAMARLKTKRPADWKRTLDALDCAILGGTVVLLETPEKTYSKQCAGWPREVREYVYDILRKDLRRKL